MREWIMTLAINMMLTLVLIVGYDKFYKQPEPTIVAIDVQSVLAPKEKAFKARLRNSENAEEMGVIYNESVAYMDKVYASINAYGKQNNLIILDRRAILSGETEDLTNELSKALAKK
ncbi:MAG: TrbI F-type domain-containing protein [Campylobacterota bacterium]|nr:TrbI F-type domain-containing protein [Campylobacterota bacterium]